MQENSKKRDNTCLVSETDSIVADFGSNDVKNIAHDAAFWREKYETLDKENNEHVKDLKDQLLISKEYEKKLTECVKLLEAKVKLLSKKNPPENNTEARTIVKPVAASVSESVPSTDAAELVKLKDLVKAYKLLTNLSIDPSDSGELVCTARNRAKKRLVKFTVTRGDEEEEGNDCTYAPMANAHTLPEYLQAELKFESVLTPALIGDVLTTLYTDGDN